MAPNCYGRTSGLAVPGAGPARRGRRCRGATATVVAGCPYEIRQGPAVLPLHRVRLADGQVARPLPRVPGLGHGRGVRRARRADDDTAAGVTTSALPIGQVDGRQATARSTGVAELDRVLGGGLVPGAVVLLAGEPGVGKSTLLLDVAAQGGAATSTARST